MPSSLPATQTDATPLAERQESAASVQAMFGRIAQDYDLLNYILSGGFHYYWRHVVASRVHAQHPERLLDLATGSGFLARALKGRRAYQRWCVGGDFCLPMLAIAQRHHVEPLVGADALHLPFADQVFDAITIAFGVRNLAGRSTGFAEMYRVLRPQGRLYILEFSHPWALLAPFYYFYLRHILPTYASWFTRERGAYEYLSDLIQAFPAAPQLADELRATGFTTVTYQRLTAGIVALHIATRT